jgi:hypothetical protein
VAVETPGAQEHVVEVEFNQQQDVILERLRQDGRYGATDAEIIRNAFRDFLRQTQL